MDQGGVSEFPILVNRFDGPVELLTKRLGEKSFNGYIKFFGEDHGQTRINVVLLYVSGLISKCFLALSTYNLGRSQCHFFVVFLILKLELHRVDALFNLGQVDIELFNAW